MTHLSVVESNFAQVQFLGTWTFYSLRFILLYTVVHFTENLCFFFFSYIRLAAVATNYVYII